jgi:hypothetical protein
MEALTRRTKVARAALAVVLVLAGPARAEEPRGWYQVELRSGELITARLVGEEAAVYLFSFEEAVIRVPKRDVRRLKPLSTPGLEGQAGPPDPPRASRETSRVPADPSAPSGSRRPGKLQGPAAAGKEKLHDALETLSSTNDAAVRRAYQLLEQNFAAARPLLQASLRHSTRRVRLLATKLLGERGSAEPDLPAVEGKLSDTEPSVRLAAVVAVRNLGPAGLPALLAYLESENQPANRKMAVKTLGLWRDRRAVAPLIGRLAREPEEGVRGVIAVSLEALTGKGLGQDLNGWEAYLSGEASTREGAEAARNGNPPAAAANPGGAPSKAR